MRALVVFESMFGNTEAIARAVAQGLATAVDVEVIDVPSAPGAVPEGVDLLVVGGPTHALGLSRPETRRTASEQDGWRASTTAWGLREWLDALPSAPPAVAACTFDTRVKRPRLPGSAARKAQRRLRRLGFRIAAPATSFWVGGTPGPLLDGEEARAWAEGLAEQLVPVAG